MRYPKNNRAGHWILSGKRPVQCPDLMTWAMWLEGSREQRRVARTEIGDVLVSTVFLGLDHQYGDGPPMLFETMVFKGMDSTEMLRCSTWEQAETIHAATVARVTETLVEKG